MNSSIQSKGIGFCNVRQFCDRLRTASSHSPEMDAVLKSVCDCIEVLRYASDTNLTMHAFAAAVANTYPVELKKIYSANDVVGLTFDIVQDNVVEWLRATI